MEAYEKEKIKFEYEKQFEKIGWSNTPLGHFNFFLQDTGQLVCRTGDQTFSADTLQEICFRKCICTPGFGTGYIEVPASVAERFLREKDSRASLNIKLIYTGICPFNGEEYFKLNRRLPSDQWGEVIHLFTFFGSGSTCKLGKMEGFLTCQPLAVEQILGISRKNSITSRYSELAEERAKMARLLKQTNEKLDLIAEAFEGSEYPDPVEESPVEAKNYMAGFEKIPLAGEKVLHPYYPDVEMWVINDDWIYSVQYNGSPFHDWSESNILADGTSCIGWRIPYNKEIAKIIRSLAKE
jgi:hypothetical protein